MNRRGSSRASPPRPGSQIRRDHPTLPVIIVTANSDVDVARGTPSTGALDHVRKPFNLDLLGRVAAAISLPPGRRSGSLKDGLGT